MLSFKMATSNNQIKQAHLQDNLKTSSSWDFKRKRAVLPVLRGFMKKAGKLSAKRKKGSLTIEAALILPLFLTAMIFLLGFGQILQTEAMLIGPLHQTGRKLAREAYIYEKVADAIKIKDHVAGKFFTGGFSVAQAKKEFISGVGEKALDRSPICGGAEGLSFLLSKVPDGEGMIDLVVSYRLQFPLQLVPAPDIPVAQRCRLHGWTGYAPDSGEKDQMVYVTENGTVYHLYPTCTHLKLSVRQTAMAKIPSLRNTSGGKYYPCESCGADCGSYVYITSTGNRYHSAASCSRLKRGIRMVPLKEAAAMPLCKRCEENQKETGGEYVD